MPAKPLRDVKSAVKQLMRPSDRKQARQTFVHKKPFADSPTLLPGHLLYFVSTRRPEEKATSSFFLTASIGHDGLRLHFLSCPNRQVKNFYRNFFIKAAYKSLYRHKQLSRKEQHCERPSSMSSSSPSTSSYPFKQGYVPTPSECIPPPRPRPQPTVIRSPQPPSQPPPSQPPSPSQPEDQEEMDLQEAIRRSQLDSTNTPVNVRASATPSSSSRTPPTEATVVNNTSSEEERDLLEAIRRSQPDSYNVVNTDTVVHINNIIDNVRSQPSHSSSSSSSRPSTSVVDAINESSLCSMCMDQPKNMAFSPCGHMCLCAGCYDDLKQSTQQRRQQLTCIVCRTPATACIRIFA